MMRFHPSLKKIRDYSNCTIEYEVEESVVDDIDGFPRRQTVTKTVTARVYNADGVVGKDKFWGGADTEGEKLWGRLSCPATFPSELVDLSNLKMTMSDGRTGFAKIRIKTQHVLTNGEDIGQKFDAIFRPD